MGGLKGNQPTLNAFAESLFTGKAMDRIRESGDDYLETKEMPFELGFKLFSFDFNINTRCAINLTLDALSPYISSSYSLDQNKMEDIRVNLPFGKIRLAEQATMTIGFRWKF